MSTRKRTRDVGVYAEPPALSIRLPFTLANFRALLAEGTRPDARYTHQQIKAWADKFWWRSRSGLQTLSAACRRRCKPLRT